MPYDFWPEPRTARFQTLAAKYRPVFARIAEEAVLRDRNRVLVHDPVRWLKEAGYTAQLLPEAEGGDGASVSDLVGLQIALAAADSNVTQALRAQFGYVLGLLSLEADDPWRQRWVKAVAKGEIVGSGTTETGQGKVDHLATTLRREGDGYRMSGRKFYTTGGLYAEWINTIATDEAGGQARVLVSTRSDGLTILDDWNGWGQQLTASGSAIFDDVAVAASDIAPKDTGWPGLLVAYAQISHLATLSGIGRGAVDSALTYIRARNRVFSHGSGKTIALDPLVQQKIGQVIAQVASANALTLQAAAELDRAQAQLVPGRAPDIDLVRRIDIEVYQAQVVVQDQILTAVTALFDALGASALSTDLGLDRFWRNARAISSHNPVIYKERILGDHAINDTPPPVFWIAGTAGEEEKS